MATEISDSDISWLLAQEGLNEYQQKAYRGLLVLKSATAAEISSRSGVPEAKLYEVMRALESKGLSSNTVGRPMKFSLQDPQKAFAASLERKREVLEREEGMLEKISKIALQAPRKEENITLLRGRDAVLRQLVSHVKENVKETFDGCFPFANAYSPMTNVTKIKAEEGVKIRLLGEVTPENYAIVKKYLRWGVEVRNCRKIVPPQPLRFSIYDHKAANFTLTDVERDYLTIWTDSEPVVRSIDDLFTYYWSNGLRVD